MAERPEQALMLSSDAGHMQALAQHLGVHTVPSELGQPGNSSPTQAMAATLERVLEHLHACALDKSEPCSNS